MAKVDNKGMVHGTAGSVVYRRYRNMNIIQGKPRKFKQTTESIRAATEFGLSSTTAAVIRQAFQSAYVHRDGQAASRSTQLVYRGIRGSLSGSAGRRDLHDADLSSIVGMEFNINSPLKEVLQFNHQVERDEQGKIRVFMGAFDSKTDIRVPPGIRKSASKYRIRFSLIGFNFRQEYYEFLEVRDLEVQKYAQVEAQEIRFEAQPEADQLLLLSVSLLAYSETRMEQGYLLLNSKNFSPCALIAAYAAEKPGEYPEGPVNMELSGAQLQRGASFYTMCYEGNQMLRNLERRIGVESTVKKKEPDPVEDSGDLKCGQRVSFRKGG
ncbi:MAG: hypothetical protein ACO1NU_13910 [Arcticibacter sp.]